MIQMPYPAGKWQKERRHKVDLNEYINKYVNK